MKIYTKTGDKGETAFIGGRISKSSGLIESVGSLDELNSNIGVCVALMNNSKDNQELQELIKELQNIQADLFSLGAALIDLSMTNPNSDNVLDNVKLLEKLIDKLSAELPVLQNFILPGGSEIAAKLHVTRSICRRAERGVVSYIDELAAASSESRKANADKAGTPVSEDYQQVVADCQVYLNRLSDLLFTMARWANQTLGMEDVVWAGSRR